MNTILNCDVKKRPANTSVNLATSKHSGRTPSPKSPLQRDDVEEFCVCLNKTVDSVKAKHDEFFRAVNSANKSPVKLPKSQFTVTNSPQNIHSQTKMNKSPECRCCKSSPTTIPTKNTSLKSILKLSMGDYNSTPRRATSKIQFPLRRDEYNLQGFMSQRREKPSVRKGRSTKRVNFNDNVEVHFVPYESRGNEEWKKNILAGNDYLIQTLLLESYFSSRPSWMHETRRTFTPSVTRRPRSRSMH